MRERLGKWVEARGLKLNAEKTRLVDSRQEAFNFLGFTVRWQKSWRSGRQYVHVEPSAKSRKKFHEQLRAQLNHWTLGRRVPETMTQLNRYLRGWSQYFHYAHGARVIGKLQWWARDRLRRWLWRKHKQKKALWSDYPDELLHGRYGLWRMPTHPAWKAKTT